MGTCEALNEYKPQAQYEFSASHIGTLSESEPQAKIELSDTIL